MARVVAQEPGAAVVIDRASIAARRLASPALGARFSAVCARGGVFAACYSAFRTGLGEGRIAERSCFWPDWTSIDWARVRISAAAAVALAGRNGGPAVVQVVGVVRGDRKLDACVTAVACTIAVRLA